MMANQSTVDLTIVIFRGAILIIAALGGILSIYLGWKLYSQGVASPVEGEASGNDGLWKIRLASMGPGVFLALFGMVILGWLVHQNMEFDDPIALPVPAPATKSTAYSSHSQNSSSQLLTPIQYQRAQQPIPNQQTVCVVAIRRRVFLNGEGLTPERISSDLATAKTYLAGDVSRVVDPKAASRLEDAIETIDELRQSTGEWRLAQ